MHEITPTEDGSVTLYVPQLNEHYHSVHGAIQESQHIFLGAGMGYFLTTWPERITPLHPLHILEAGFGTGLNAYLTLVRAEELQVPVCYHSLEKYPLSPEESTLLNYAELINFPNKNLFQELHRCSWGKEHQLTSHFRFCKHQEDFRNIGFQGQFDLVYYDAFNPDVQPHLWTTKVFERFYEAMHPESLLVTYCVKGTVKQALRSVGFTLKRLPGPPGKREMLRARK